MVSYNQSNTALAATESKPHFHAAIGAVFGLAFLLAAWLIDFFVNDYNVSVSGILAMHKANPLHFIIESAPIVLSVFSYYFSVQNSKRNDYFLELIKQRENSIIRNVQLAKKIGSNEYA